MQDNNESVALVGGRSAGVHLAYQNEADVGVR